MPAATEQPAAKKERDELLWQALKEHIMRERQKKKEGKLDLLSFLLKLLKIRYFFFFFGFLLDTYRTRGRSGRGTFA